jgi:hypothetical protein
LFIGESSHCRPGMQATGMGERHYIQIELNQRLDRQSQNRSQLTVGFTLRIDMGYSM